MAYYYLMAQLPFLVYEQKPPMSSETFKVLAGTLMNEKDVALMDCLSLDPAAASSYADSFASTGCDFIDSWREWERTLRLNISKHRSVHLKRENHNASDPPFVPSDAASAASRAVNSDGSPLEGEILIDKARWNAIDELVGNDYFDRNNVYAYFLKLLLLERREAFNAEKGFSEYKSLYTQIIEDAHNTTMGEL